VKSLESAATHTGTSTSTGGAAMMTAAPIWAGAAIGAALYLI
jgi:hypothetical protein